MRDLPEVAQRPSKGRRSPWRGLFVRPTPRSLESRSGGDALTACIPSGVNKKGELVIVYSHTGLPAISLTKLSVSSSQSIDDCDHARET